MYKNKKAFSIVEIIITISIIALLTVIGISSKNNYDNNMNNAKIVADVETINNALTSYSEETQTLPMPGGNTNFYGIDTSYKHSYDDSDTFGVYGSLTEESLAKKYLDILPLDPRTNAYYSYGKTKESNEFEIASVQYVDNEPVAKVIGNYENNAGPLNLIRQYNGSNFVFDGSQSAFPYNPEELVLIVTTKTGAVYREGDTISAGTNPLEIFFSDGSVSVLEAGTTITLNELNFEGKNNLSTIVKIGLGAGKIWTKATKLNDSSEFEVYTQDSAAAVRGTIFGVSYNVSTTTTEVIVIEGIVDVYNNEGSIVMGELRKSVGTIGEIEVTKGDDPKSIKIINGEEQNPETTNSETLPEFTQSSDSTEIIEIVTTEPIEATPEVEECTTFITDGGEECVYPDESLTASGYSLVSYAPYNHPGDLNMYTKSGKTTLNSEFVVIENCSSTDLQCTSTNESFGAKSYDKDNSFVTYENGEKGIYIDNDGSGDYIKYSNLNLEGDFAIEMNVSSDTITTNGNRYFFDVSGNGLQISKSDTFNIIKINGQNVCLNCLPILSEITTDFIKIKLINGDKLYIGERFYELDPSIHTVNNITNLFVGTHNTKILQINGLIDYVEIYTKN